MEEFSKETLTAEESFWVMWYFLQGNYELSNGTFDVSDILSASEPIAQGRPADSGMVSFWNEAIEKYRKNGPPPLKTLRK